MDALLGRRDTHLRVGGRRRTAWRDGVLGSLLYSDATKRRHVRACWYDNVRLGTKSAKARRESLSATAEPEMGVDNAGGGDGDEFHVGDDDGGGGGGVNDDDSVSQWSDDDDSTWMDDDADDLDDDDDDLLAAAAAAEARDARNRRAKHATWIVFDGTPSAAWVEALLHHAVGGSCIASASRAPQHASTATVRMVAEGLPESLPAQDDDDDDDCQEEEEEGVRIIFETDSLAHCSPSLLQSLTVLHYGALATPDGDSGTPTTRQHQLTWGAVLDSFVAEVDVFAQVAQQEFQRAGNSRLAAHARRHARGKGALLDRNTLDAVLRQRFHLDQESTKAAAAKALSLIHI